MTKEELATMLNGRSYGGELFPGEGSAARRAELVIVFGASDDLMEFRGKIDDEMGACNGGTALIDAKGLLPERSSFDGDGQDDDRLEEYFQRKRAARKIDAIWCRDGYSWIYETDIPHATFDIVEDGEKYCRGIVFSLAELI